MRPETSAARTALALGALVALSVPLLFWNLASYSLVNLDEGVLHHMARHMVESGDWLRVEYLGERHVYDTLMKAPLQYWVRAVAIAALGDGYWAMRLPSALFGLATVLAVYGLARQVATPRAAFLAGLVQLTTLQFVYLHGARTGESETLTCFLYALLALLYLRTLRRGGSWVPHHLVLFAFANVKVPLVFVPLLAEGLHLALFRDARPRARSWLLTGLALAPLGFAWQIAHVAGLGGEAVDALRTMTGEASGAVDYKGLDSSLAERARSYGSWLLFGAFPWSLACLPAAVDALRRRAERPERAALVLFAAAALVFFLAVSKRLPWYILPVYPLAAALVGVWLSELPRRPSRPALAACGAVLALTAAVHFGPGYGPAELHPFARSAWTFEPQPALRDGALALAAGGALGGALLGTLARRRPHPARALIALTALVLAGFALVRCALPLRYTEYLSPLERQAILVERARRAGTLTFPCPVPAPTLDMARVFFADEYRIRRVRGRRVAAFELVGLRPNPRRPHGSAIWMDPSGWPWLFR